MHHFQICNKIISVCTFSLSTSLLQFLYMKGALLVSEESYYSKVLHVLLSQIQLQELHVYLGNEFTVPQCLASIQLLIAYQRGSGQTVLPRVGKRKRNKPQLC